MHGKEPCSKDSRAQFLLYFCHSQEYIDRSNYEKSKDRRQFGENLPRPELNCQQHEHSADLRPKLGFCFRTSGKVLKVRWSPKN